MVTIRDTAQCLFPGFEIKLKENKQATRAALRPAWDVYIRIPGHKRGKHVATIIINKE